jgi:site-specific DNA-methyltransferase (adenine-specific)
MRNQTSFSLRGRNPDVLTCIANLSNDEVFTPPEFANQMLDTLTEAWAAENNGANLWSNKAIRFLDPVTKTGVFLREITSRLTKGLSDEIPDLKERVNHILTKQVFGIGITQLTSLLARRSLYCSKQASGKHSIATGFDSDDGNIWFERIEHSWNDKKCEFCGAPKTILDREAERENYAYAFIHTNDINARITELFGEDMQFDVIIGNPPYQMKGGAGGSSDSSIYHLFVEQAKKLNPKYLSMVIPSRWLAGGRGLGEFRQEMLSSRNLHTLVDFPFSREVFPNVEVKGGICYFLWTKSQKDLCDVTVIRGQEVINSSSRKLDEYDVFVRDPRAVGILQKITSTKYKGMDTLVSNREPFKMESNFKGFNLDKQEGDINLYRVTSGKRRIDWVSRKTITKNTHLIDKWKVLVPKAGSDGGQKLPDSVLGKPWLSQPTSVCTGSFLVIPASSAKAAQSIQSYYSTRFFRFLVSLRKITQDAFSHMYRWVPIQSWDRQWTDEDLYKKYGLTNKEIEYIEAVIRPMEVSKESSDE